MLNSAFSLLPRQHRLTEEYRFRKLRKHGTVARSPYYLVSFVANDQLVSRFGFIATKKLGKATKRNRAIRVLREAIRTLLPDIKPGFDVVFVAHARVLNASSPEVADLLRHTLKQYNLL